MRYKFLLPLVLISLLSACANVERKESAADKMYKDAKSAAVATQPLMSVQKGKFVNIDITSNSPSIQGQKKPNKFEVVSVNGRKDQKFNFIVAALCDCLGFRKWSIAPEAYLFDNNGELVAQETTLNPIAKSLTGSFPADGEYKVLVVADDTNDGSPIAEVPIQLGLVPVATLPQTVHPTGIVQVYWRQAN